MAWAPQAPLHTPTELPWEEAIGTWQEAIGTWEDGLRNVTWNGEAAATGSWTSAAPLA